MALENVRFKEKLMSITGKGLQVLHPSKILGWRKN
jgi:hypothetical protein